MSEEHGGHHEEHGEGSFWTRYVFSTDHKVIGMQYLCTGLLMAVLGGFLSYLFRMQLAFPGKSIPGFGELTPAAYNVSITMHGTIMIFWVAMPVLLAAFGNLLIPTMIGAADMAFPRLNMLSYWVFFLSTVLLVASFFVPGGAFAGGWTAYPPLSANEGYKPIDFLHTMGGNLWILAVALEFIAFLMGGINFLTTTINMRAKGLTFFRLPMVVWMINIATLIFMFSVGPLIAGAVMLLMDRTVGTGFYNPAAGGDPILFQHLFWFFGHPEVYVLLLPSIGFMSEILPVFSRKPLFGYRMIVYSTVIAGFLSFIVWAHHQFVSGIDPRMATFFSLTTIMISVPFAVMIFSLMATLWGGSIEFSLPMLFSLGSLGEFLLGGVTGIFLGASAFDIYAHGTYFVVAHFHYTLIPIVIFGGSAAIYYWYPKFVGRHLNKTLGHVHFWVTTIFFNSLFLPLFVTGMAGQHRRLYTYEHFSAALNNPFLTKMQVIATGSMILVALAQAVFLFNFFYSLRNGEPVGENPWQATTLEWTVPSPPPHGNFVETPVVHRGPYDYNLPGRPPGGNGRGESGSERDFWPQNVLAESAQGGL